MGGSVRGVSLLRAKRLAAGENKITMLHITRSAHYYQALRRARWGGSLALELLRLAVSSGQTALSPDGKTFKALSSGQTALSPDGKTFKALSSGQTALSPDGKTFKAVSSGQTALSPDGKTFLSLIPMQSRQKPDIK